MEDNAEITCRRLPEKIEAVCAINPFPELLRFIVGTTLNNRCATNIMPMKSLWNISTATHPASAWFCPHTAHSDNGHDSMMEAV